jgi:hypothetical protein
MKCETARNRLMALTDPSAVPAPLASHLEACTGCQTWQRLLAQVEAGIIETAPATTGDKAKRKLMAQFREPAPSATPVVKPKSTTGGSKVLPTIQPLSARPAIGERLARLWPAGLVAAALLLGVLVWSSLQKPEVQPVAALPPDPFLDKVVAAKVRLDAAPDAAGRLAVLDALQKDIHEEAATLSKVTPGAEMDALARWYEGVVTDGIIEQARLLSPQEQKAKLPQYKQRLVDAEQEANRLAAEAPPGADRPLKDMARAAEKGRTELARMIQG